MKLESFANGDAWAASGAANIARPNAKRPDFRTLWVVLVVDMGKILFKNAAVFRDAPHVTYSNQNMNT